MPARRKARSERREAGRLDDMGLDAEAGGEPENRAGVLGDVGLVEGDPHGASFRPRVARRQWPKHPMDKGFVRLLVIRALAGLALSL